MITEITSGIRISVHTRYREMYSNPKDSQYLFSYQIRIRNESDQTVQLLRRHWHIFDSSGEYHEVEGEGVIGHQPIINPGDTYEYESACNLTTDIGKMHGSYLMRRIDDGSHFRVIVPEFLMILPSRLN